MTGKEAIRWIRSANARHPRHHPPTCPCKRCAFVQQNREKKNLWRETRRHRLAHPRSVAVTRVSPLSNCLTFGKYGSWRGDPFVENPMKVKGRNLQKSVFISKPKHTCRQSLHTDENVTLHSKIRSQPLQQVIRNRWGIYKWITPALYGNGDRRYTMNVLSGRQV